MTKFTHSLALLSLAILTSCSSGPDSTSTNQDLPRHQAVGGPVPPPGLTQVTHDTSMSGTGTSLSPLIVNTSNIQKRISGTCSDPDGITIVNADGTVGCSTTTLGGTLTSGDLVVANGAHSTTNYAGTTAPSDKAITALSASGVGTFAYFVDSGTNGVTVSNNVASIDATYTQRRVTGTCTDPQAIVSVNLDGTVSCTTDVLGGTLTSGKVPRATGSHTLGDGSWSDTGSALSTTNPVTVSNAAANLSTLNTTFGCQPAALPGTPTVTDSWDPWTSGSCATGRISHIRVVTAQFGSILGSLKGGNAQVGDIVILENHGDGNESIGNGSLKILIRTTSDHSVPTADHIFTPDLTDIVIPYTGAVMLYYDASNIGWIPYAISTGGFFERLAVSEMSLMYPLTPAGLPNGRTDNYDISSGGEFGCGLACASWIRLNGDSGGSQISGIVPHNVNAGPSTLLAQGQILYIENVGGDITLCDEVAATSCGSTNSSAGNRIVSTYGDVVIKRSQIVMLIYDQQGGGFLSQARWHVIGGAASQVTGTPGDLAIFGTGGGSVGNFAGSTPSDCAAGTATTHESISAAGALTHTCLTFVNAAGTGLSLSGSTLGIAAGGVGPTQLANTAVTAGSYTNASITVDAQGRLTAASNGAAGLTGAGTTNYLARYTNSSNIGTGLVTDDNTNLTTASGMFQAGPYNGVTRDTTSGWYPPNTSAEWTTILNGTGIGAPSHLWRLQESSGTLADSIGSTTLTNTGTMTYQTSVTGWSRKAMSAPNSNAGYYLINTTDTTLPDQTSSYTVLLFIQITAAPSGDRDLLGVGNCNGSIVAVTSGLFPKVRVGGTNTATGSNSVGTTTVRPWLLRYNHTASTMKVDTDLESISPTFATPDGTKHVYIGGGGCLGNAPGFNLLYGTMWQGSAAEMTDAQVAQLFARLKGATANQINGDLALTGFRWSTYAPTANHGTLSSDAINSMGRVTSVGANTSVTITFGGGGFTTTSHCFAQIASSGAADLIKVTPSNTAPVFSCFDSTTGTAANCDDFEYQCWGF